MLIDEIKITVRAGHGGPGKVHFDGNGPDGGNGGKGGDVYITVTSDLKALNQFSADPEVTAENGQPGMSHRSFGKKGQDKTITLPVGTSITDQDSGQTWELTQTDQTILICKGGRGGRGNLEFKSSKNRSPDYAQPGLEGDFKKLKLNLRFIAEYGLIGLPNAGKSSLLNELTNSKAVVAAYPFTTLEANLGVMGRSVIADIPGLIEGASHGKGLGTGFLKHIEKVKVLLHCIASDSPDVLKDYLTINQELQKYNPDLLTKPRLILLTKTDLLALNGASGEVGINDQVSKLKSLKFPIYPVSIYNPESIKKLTAAFSEL